MHKNTKIITQKVVEEKGKAIILLYGTVPADLHRD